VTEHEAPHLPAIDPDRARAVPASSLTPELLSSLLVDGDDELAAWALRHALAESPRADVYDGLLAGAMVIIGERWASGQWSVADEHLASLTFQRALERVRPERGPERRIGPLAVLAGVAGERHMIGLICLGHLLEEGGWTVANLGADVPSADLATYVSRQRPTLVALTASHAARLETVAGAVAAVREARPEPRLPVMLGGRVTANADELAALDLDWTGASLSDAADFAADVAANLPETDPDPD
jgi:methanogenic corrinoid protein MtbC1